MPSIESACRNQFAVMWVEDSTSPDKHGRKLLVAGVEIQVRFESVDVFTRPPKGDEEELVKKMVVNQDIALGTIIFEGKSTDLPVPVTDVTGLFEVVEFPSIPDVKGREVRRVCGLKKFGDTLPTLV